MKRNRPTREADLFVARLKSRRVRPKKPKPDVAKMIRKATAQERIDEANRVI